MLFIYCSIISYVFHAFHSSLDNEEDHLKKNKIILRFVIAKIQPKNPSKPKLEMALRYVGEMDLYVRANE